MVVQRGGQNIASGLPILRIEAIDQYGDRLRDLSPRRYAAERFRTSGKRRTKKA